MRQAIAQTAEQVYAGLDASQKLPAGKDASYDIGDLMVNNGVGNDTISSLKMPNDGGPYGWGYTVTLYADAGYRGASKSFMSDAEYVGDELDNQTSSIRIMAMME